MTTKTLELNNIERKVFWVLVTLLGVVAAFYLYSVASLTLAVVDRDNINRATHEFMNTAVVLEAEYIAQANSFTLAYAHGLGFNEVNAKFARGSSAKLSVAR
ncbi:MAG: hypothetical protein HZB10_04140 [Candidatus Yonathbacteria bacterium]|nr:hypothetical protein [Candidatus Yonathbacteria bacterium]